MFVYILLSFFTPTHLILVFWRKKKACRQSISIIDIWLQELGYTIEQEGADQQSLFDLAVAEIWV